MFAVSSTLRVMGQQTKKRQSAKCEANPFTPAGVSRRKKIAIGLFRTQK
jgi:hypothetical protein